MNQVALLRVIVCDSEKVKIDDSWLSEFWNLPCGASSARALTGSDFSTAREPIGDGRIPVVECPGELLQKQKGKVATISKASSARVTLSFSGSR